jgi:hypothetical protein
VAFPSVSPPISLEVATRWGLLRSLTFLPSPLAFLEEKGHLCTAGRGQRHDTGVPSPRVFLLPIDNQYGALPQQPRRWGGVRAAPWRKPTCTHTLLHPHVLTYIQTSALVHWYVLLHTLCTSEHSYSHTHSRLKLCT